MRKIFKKVSAILTSALMVGLSMGVATAATYPAPFVEGGVANVAIVYGADTPAGIDIVPAANIQSNLQSHMGASDGSTTVSGGDNWQVGTSADRLEVGEAFANVYSFIGDDELALLEDQTISNEKGEAAFQQFFYFEDTSSSMVNYTENDDDEIGLFLYFDSGDTIARYVMDFSTDLKSDIESDGELSDIEDKQITFLGKTYTITDATNSSSGISLTMMSGALGGTVQEGTPLTLDGYTVDVSVTSSSAAEFTITSASGTEVTDKMAKGDSEKLSDGSYFAVTDISYEGYSGEGAQQTATFYIGADKIELTNGSSMSVNGNSIGATDVRIAHTEASSDVSISEISVNITADDDLYVPAGSKLSESPDLDEPEALITQNWDIQYAGLKAVDYEDLSLTVSGNGKKYTLKWQNYNGDEVVLPLLWTNGTSVSGGVYPGDDVDELFQLCENGTRVANITKKTYFLLNTADPRVSTTNAKTILVQYKGSDKITDTSPVAKFTINPGGPGEYTETTSITKTGANSGHFTLNVAGGQFTFSNATSANLNDYEIILTSNNQCSFINSTAVHNSAYIRTYYNTFINITDANVSETLIGATDETGSSHDQWLINVTVDDTNRDDDTFTLPDTGQVFYATINYSTGDATLTYTGTGNWQTDPEDSTVQKYINRYGAEIVSTDPTDDPASIVARIPKTIVEPLVYITQAEGVVVSTSAGGGSTQLGEVIYKDTETSSYSNKNVIVVGGSCINSAAASLVGEPACGADFTDKTGIGSGQFLIQSYGADEQTVSSKMVLLVAGYDAADTANAATYLRTQTVDTTAGKKYKGTNSNTAELVVE